MADRNNNRAMTTTRKPKSDTAVATRPVDTAVEAAGSSSNPHEITQSLEAANATMHLVSPASKCGRIPDGCEVMLSRVLVNADENLGEVYPITGGRGKLGLGKVPLRKIGLAAGITWDPVLSRRDDNSSDPAYCQYTAVGYIFDFDGSEKTIIGTKAIDLRRGSALWEDAHIRAREKALDDAEGKLKRGQHLSGDQKQRALEAGYAAAEKELRHARIHILSNAQSKAEHRAIRSIGLKSSYTKDELTKPFVAAKLIFTGESSNPVNSEIYARARAEKFLGSKRAAYGAPLALPPAPNMAPPPITRQLDEDDYIPTGAIDADTNGNGDHHDDAQRETTEQQHTAGETETTEKQTAKAEIEKPPDFEVRFGRDKGKMVSDLNDRGLSFLIDVFTSSIDNPDKAQYKDKNTRERAIVYEWIDYWRDVEGDDESQGEMFNDKK